MRLPQFLVAGAMKSGTTALYEYLIQHPQVFLSTTVKESRFLTGLSPEKDPEICKYIPVVSDLARYQELFLDAKPDQVIGEVDPWCMYLYQNTIPRINEYLSSPIKIIQILRNPVDRCHSNYYQFVKQEWPTTGFENMVINLEKKQPLYWYEKMCMEIGLYSQPVKAYLDAFHSENVLIILYDDFRTKPVETMKTICQHIGIDDSFQFDMSFRANEGGIPRSKIIHRILRHHSILTELLKPIVPLKLRRKWRYTLINKNMQKYPPLNPEMREILINYYKDDVIKLQDLIKRDLTSWLG